MIIRQKQKANRGVTLVEIAIVLVIIGLLLGGVLKGQELINNAKVRSIADRQNSLKVAWFAFIDRFQAIPGDYINAKQHIPGSENGNGNGEVVLEESALAFQHMTAAGYLRCPQCTEATAGGAAPTASNSLTNQYGGVMSIYHDADSYATIGAIVGKRLLIHTGPLIPSNIISEVDRKIDDGLANTGDMVFNKWTSVSQNANVPIAIVCMAQDATASNAAKSIGGTLVGTAAQAWRGAQATPAVVQNCGASVSI